MKKLLLFLIMGIFLITPVSAQWEFDNVIEYSEDDKVATFVNLYGFGSTIGDAELTSHVEVEEVLNVFEGLDVLTLKYNIENYGEAYEDGIGEVEFIFVPDGQKVTRDYTIKKANYISVEVEEYYDTCEIQIIGGVEKEICERTITGSHIEERIESWTPLEDNTIPAGSITLGLFSEVRRGDYIDGVITLFGKKITRHASWTADLNDEIIAYFKLNETSGDMFDSTPNLNNFTIAGSGLTRPGSSAVIGNSYQYGGSAWTYANNGTHPCKDNSCTIAGWISFSGTSNRNLYAESAGSLSNSMSLGTNSPSGKVYIQHRDPCCDSLSSATSVNDGSYHHFAYVGNTSSRLIYIDGSLDASDTNVQSLSYGGSGQYFGTRPDPGNDLFNGLMDEYGIWDKPLSSAQITQLYNSGSGITYKSSFDNSPTLTLNAPPNNTLSNLDPTQITFDISVLDDLGIVNSSIYIDGILNTTTAGGLELSINYTEHLNISGEGLHFWYADAWDSAAFNTSSDQRTILIDTTAPSVNITAPVNATQFITLDPTLSTDINVSISDNTGFSNCWYVNASGETPITCGNNISQAFPKGWNIYTYHVNDTVGNVVSDTISFNVDQVLSTFNANGTEGSNSRFELNVSNTPSSVSSATLTYDSTEYSATILNIIGNNYSFFTTIALPVVATDTVKDFHWNWTLSDSSVYGTPTQQQTVLNVNVGTTCSSAIPILNYTLYDEGSQSLISSDFTISNASIEVDLTLSTYGTTNVIETFNGTFQSNNVSVCITPLGILDSGEFRMDSIAKYSSFDRVTEYNNIQNFRLNSSNTEETRNLLDLLIIDSQEFVITYKDENLIPVDEALIDIQRYYVGENRHLTVEKPKTDITGTAVVHLVLTEVLYNVVVTKEGNILATFQDIPAVCQDVSTGSCTIPLNALTSSLTPDDYSNAGGINYHFQVDKDTRDVKVLFNALSGSKTISVNITKFDQWGNTTACSNSLTSTSGTLTCNVPTSYGNTSYLARVYSDDLFVGQALINLEQDSIEVFGYTGIIFVIIMFATIPLMFISSPMGLLFGGMISIIMAVLLNLFNGGILGKNATIIYLIIASIILIWRIAKEERL